MCVRRWGRLLMCCGALCCVCMQESACLYDLAYKLMDTMHRSEWVGG